MSYNFDDDIPIYLQIIDNIKMKIISQKYLSQQRIPSVRELSFEYEVNPNTIQKALTELEKEGLIFTDSTNGKYVTKDTSLIEKIRKQTIEGMVDDFYKSMEKIGISQEEVIKILIKNKGVK